MNIEEKIAEVLKKTGYIHEFMEDDDMSALLNDPVVRLLIAAVTHQTEIISDEIEKVEDKLLDRYLSEFIPQGSLVPTPTVAIMQIGKKTQHGIDNDEESILDENVRIRIGTEKQIDKRPQFIPLLKTKIVAAEVTSVHLNENNRWSIEITLAEPLTTLSNMSLYFQSLTGCESIRIFSSDFEIPHYRLSDFSALPFVSSLFGCGNAEYARFQYQLIQKIYDSLSTTQGLYVFITDSQYSRNIQQNDGRICLEVEIISNTQPVTLSLDTIKLNSVPVASINIWNARITRAKKLVKINLDTQERFLTIVGNDNARYVSVNSIMTERQNIQTWSSQLQRLVEQYYENHFLYAQSFDSRIDSRISKLLAEIKTLNIPNQSKDISSIYFTLRDNGPESVNIQYLTTRNTNLNQQVPLPIPVLDSSSPSEYTINQQSILTTLVHGPENAGDVSQGHTLAKYHFKDLDRIVTKSDISDFCKHILKSYFNIPDAEIRITRSIVSQTQNFKQCDMLNNSNISLLQPMILVTVVGISDTCDKQKMANTISRMIEPRIIGFTPVNVVVE